MEATENPLALCMDNLDQRSANFSGRGSDWPMPAQTSKMYGLWMPGPARAGHENRRRVTDMRGMLHAFAFMSGVSRNISNRERTRA